MKRLTIIFALGALALNLPAQELTTDDIAEIRSSFVKTPEVRALQNGLTAETDLRDFAENRELVGKIDHLFKYRVGVKGITNQKSSGRCWMFTSMNVLRPDVMKKYDLKEFDFSHNYNYFWDMFEKSNLFLENVIASAGHKMTDRDVEFYFSAPVSDGGVWNMFYNVAEKYGVVPESVMPETAHSNYTSQMRSILNQKLRKGGWELRTLIENKAKPAEVQKAKIAIMKDIYRILALCLGEPPTKFEWRYETKGGEIKTINSTPLDFYHGITPEDYDPQSYIMLMNDPTRDYYKVYEIANYRNLSEGVNWKFLNLPIEDLKKAALASIKGDEAMYASVAVKQYNADNGICDTEMYDYESLFGVKLDMEKKAEILTRQTASTHAMTLMAVDTDENDVPVKWQFENSWGPTAGYKGYMTFTDRWFDKYVFRLVINRRYLDEKALDALKHKPVQLPAWDYMY